MSKHFWVSVSVASVSCCCSFQEAAKDIRLNGVTVPYLYRLMSNWSNYGLTFADGSKWHHTKKFSLAVLNKIGFTKQRVMNLTSNECSNVVDKLLALKGVPVNIEHQLFGAITNITMDVLMSRQFDIDDPLFKQFHEDFITLFSIVAKLKSPYDFAPWLAYFAGESSDVRTLERIMERFYTFCDQVIEEHETSLPDEPRDFVDSYLAALKAPNTSHGMSRANLRVVLKDLIIGGLSGPSVSFTWLLLLVGELTDVQEQMVAEIKQVIGTDRAPTPEDERACPYVRAVIVETIRYVTVTPIHRHSTSQGATTLNGYHIPAGSLVLEDVHSSNHDRAVFGDPELFRPERFLGADGDRLQKHVATFGFGPRQCPATSYTYTMLFLFIVGLLQRLQLKIPDGAEQQSVSGMYNVGVWPSQPLLIVLPR